MKLAEVLRIDSVYTLALAIAVWIPCVLQYSYSTARPEFIAGTFLYGTAYLIFARMTTALALLYLAKTGKIENGQ